MATRAAETTDTNYRPSYLAASIAAGLVFLLYLFTLSPSTAMWDTSEYIAAAYTLGIPHPPGNPFFVLLGRFFTLLPIAPNPAMRVNILAAVCSSVAAGCWFLVTERVLVGWLSERWQRIAGGSLAVIIGATSFTVWAQSVVNEKVYTVSLALLAIVAWLTVRWCDDPDGKKADNILVLIAYLLGLGYGVHMAGMLPAPAIGLAVVIRRPRDKGLPALAVGVAALVAYVVSTVNPIAAIAVFLFAAVLLWIAWKPSRLILAAVAALVLGGSTFATQPIRASFFPGVNEGEPTGCRTKIEASCLLSKQTYTSFMYNFNREQYGKPELSDRRGMDYGAQVGMWWFYFKWQWLRDAHLQNQRLQGALAAVFLVLGLLGGWVHYKRDPRSFTFFGPLMFTLTLLLIYYLNFLYGASQAPELGDSVNREVRDRDYFYLWSFSAFSVWAALGLTYVWESLAAVIGRESHLVGGESIELPTNRGWAVSAPVLAIVLVPLFGNWSAASRSGQTDTADFAIDMLNSVEPYGILVTVGDNDTFPLWYAQEVLGVRKDVLIANTSLLNTDWYGRQMLRRPVYDYDEAQGPAVYRGKKWTKPAGPPLDLSFDQMDAIPIGQEVSQPQRFEAGNIKAIVPPQFLQKADMLVLMMIQANKRELFFSRTSVDYPFQNLGLGKYLLTQGLVRKVMRDSVRAGKDTLYLQGEGMVDMERSLALWKDYKAPASLVKKNDWIDRPSVGIPYLYVSTGLVLSEALTREGNQKESTVVLERASAVAKATKIAESLGSEQVVQPLPSTSGDTAQKKAVPLAPQGKTPTAPPPEKKAPAKKSP